MKYLRGSPNSRCSDHVVSEHKLWKPCHREHRPTRANRAEPISAVPELPYALMTEYRSTNTKRHPIESASVLSGSLRQGLAAPRGQARQNMPSASRTTAQTSTYSPPRAPSSSSPSSLCSSLAAPSFTTSCNATCTSSSTFWRLAWYSAAASSRSS